MSKGITRYKDVALAKQRQQPSNAMYCRTGTVISEFEEKISARELPNCWAKIQKGLQPIKQILKDNETLVCWWKVNRWPPKEIELNHVAEGVGCESVRTDLGEFIARIGGWWTAYHIVTTGCIQIKGYWQSFSTKSSVQPIDNYTEEMTNTFVRCGEKVLKRSDWSYRC